MSTELISAFLKEKSPAFFSVIVMCSATLLFGPRKLIDTLGLEPFIEEYRTLIGAAFLFSFAFIIVLLLSWLFKKIIRFFTSKSNYKKSEKLRAEYMENLTREEVLYLLPFWGGLNTLVFPMDDGVRGGLDAKGIIYRASNTGSVLTGFAYNIQPWALEFLKKHPETYEKHVGKIETPEDFEALYKNGKPWERRLW